MWQTASLKWESGCLDTQVAVAMADPACSSRERNVRSSLEDNLTAEAEETKSWGAKPDGNGHSEDHKCSFMSRSESLLKLRPHPEKDGQVPSQRGPGDAIKNSYNIYSSSSPSKGAMVLA